MITPKLSYLGQPLLFIALNDQSSVSLTASDVYLGTGLPKRTVIRIIDKLEALNVVKKTTDTQDRRITRIEFSSAFARLFESHLEECCAEQMEHFRHYV